MAIYQITNNEIKTISRTTFSETGLKEREDLQQSDIGYCTVQLLNDKGLIDEGTFEFLREDKTCTFQLLKMKSEVSETNKKYNKYRILRDPELVYGEQEYYVARNWGKESAAAFVNKISAKFPMITYHLHTN